MPDSKHKRVSTPSLLNLFAVNKLIALNIRRAMRKGIKIDRGNIIFL
jgi:hypothetical protein